MAAEPLDPLHIADHDATADALANVLIADTGDSAVHVKSSFPWEGD